MIHHGPSRVSDTAYAHIRQRVLSGELKPGSRLVTRTLAGEIGSSLNPVREALGRLAGEGVIDHVPGAGAFVHIPNWQEIDDLYDFREAVEPHAAARAARFISDAELDELHSICSEALAIAHTIQNSNEQYASGSLLEHWIDAEERFHELILRASRNRVMQRAISECRLLSLLFMRHREINTLVTLSVAARTWLRHRRLVRALSCGDRDLAALMMRDQIREGRRVVVALFRRQGIAFDGMRMTK